MEYVYLLQEREFVRLKEPTYKIGRTGQKNPLDRIKQYANNSKVITICAVENSVAVEKTMKIIFKRMFEQRREYGIEYFSGDVKQMQLAIYDIVGDYLADDLDSETDSVELDLEAIEFDNYCQFCKKTYPTLSGFVHHQTKCNTDNNLTDRQQLISCHHTLIYTIKRNTAELKKAYDEITRLRKVQMCIAEAIKDIKLMNGY